MRRAERKRDRQTPFMSVTCDSEVSCCECLEILDFIHASGVGLLSE
jgi:hypothetical protein